MKTAILHQQTCFGTFTLMADEAGLSSLLFPQEQENALADDADPEGAILTPTPTPVLLEAASQLLAYLDGRLFTFDLPLSITGTPFQKQVWEELRAIPYGETRSYGELAARLGNRNKARAVGGAAHANPLGIIIPCHRLIGASGSLTGFGGGLAMKQSLLALEQQYRR